MKRVLLVSGGIDSTIMMAEHLYAPENKDVQCELLYVKCGEVYENVELQHLRKFITKYNILYKVNEISINNAEVGAYNRFVPNRNLTIASIAVTSLGADEIWIGGLKDDNVVDKNEQAYKSMSSILSTFSEKPVIVKSPYSNFTKGDLVHKFLCNENIPYEVAVSMLQDTFSCYNSSGEHCGNCPACFRKFAALESNGVKSGIKLHNEILKEYLPKLYRYSPNRINHTLLAMKEVFSSIECYDLDGTLCEIEPTIPYSEKVVIPRMREKINSSKSLRVIYTSRLERWREVTETWLKRNKIEYEVLIMDKPYYDVIYDDKAKAF